jgi:hypothetical protein
MNEVSIDVDNVGSDVNEAAQRLIRDGYELASQYNAEDNDDPDLKSAIEDQLLVARAISDLSMLVRRLSHALRKSGSKQMPDQADDYIKRKGLQGSILR